MVGRLGDGKVVHNWLVVHTSVKSVQWSKLTGLVTKFKLDRFELYTTATLSGTSANSFWPKLNKGISRAGLVSCHAFHKHAQTCSNMHGMVMLHVLMLHSMYAFPIFHCMWVTNKFCYFSTGSQWYSDCAFLTSPWDVFRGPSQISQGINSK